MQFLRLRRTPKLAVPKHETDIFFVDEDGVFKKMGPDGSVAEVGSGGGGGSMPVQVLHTPLTDDDIKALPSDGSNLPIIVTPVPDAGTMILPVFVAAVGPAIAYGSINGDAGLLILPVAGGGAGVLASWLESQGQVTQLIGQSGARSVAYTALSLAAALGVGTTGVADGADVAFYDGSAWQLTGNNGGDGDFTDGDPANRLDLYVYYVVVPTA